LHLIHIGVIGVPSVPVGQARCLTHQECLKASPTQKTKNRLTFKGLLIKLVKIVTKSLYDQNENNQAFKRNSSPYIPQGDDLNLASFLTLSS
jgi:hypothetical protein